LESLATPLNDNDLANNANEEDQDEKNVLMQASKDVESVVNASTTVKRRRSKGKFSQIKNAEDGRQGEKILETYLISLNIWHQTKVLKTTVCKKVLSEG
jgi:hypothetical protein